ncbi:unnamed protein product, partial [Pelagomonas calceolata]
LVIIRITPLGPSSEPPRHRSSQRRVRLAVEEGPVVERALPLDLVRVRVAALAVHPSGFPPANVRGAVRPFISTFARENTLLEAALVGRAAREGAPPDAVELVAHPLAFARLGPLRERTVAVPPPDSILRGVLAFISTSVDEGEEPFAALLLRFARLARRRACEASFLGRGPGHGRCDGVSVR